MQSGPFPEYNRRYTAPLHWDSDRNGECSTLDVFQDDQQMISRWQLTWRDRLRILFGASVWLYIYGAAQHPVVGFNVARTVFTEKVDA